jgi:alkaline phosphatase D
VKILRHLLPVILLALAASTAEGASAFRYGVAAGDVRSTSAILWTRAPASGVVTLQLTDLAGYAVAGQSGRTVRVTRAHDNTLSILVTGLRPHVTYRYVFRQRGVASAFGTFRTPPSRRSDATVRFAVTGDVDAQRAPGATRPYYNDLGVYRRMQGEHNDFNVNLGDTIYSDSEVPGVPPALSLAAKWAKYRQNLAIPALRNLRGAAPFYSQWDDHEFINDFSRPEMGDALYRVGRQAFLDYAPASYRSSLGTYRRFRWGANVELFILDLRSFRSAKAAGSCINPDTGQPDLAPGVPQLIRAGTGLTQLVHAVAQPCLDAINDPTRTMLGPTQLHAFLSGIASSTARFKVVLTEDPMQQFYALPYDRWEGYAHERTAVLSYLKAHVKNVALIATDTHANFVNDARLSTLESLNHRVDSGITEVVAGPAATMTFAREIDTAVGIPGAWLPIVKGLLRAPKIGGFFDGIAMRCASANTYSYAEVKATATRLTIALRDIHGKPVVDDLTGKACAPTVVPYAG